MNFIISRTDNIGDVMLTLPLAGFLKEKYPTCQIAFIGKKYTKALIIASQNIDVFWDKEDILENNQIVIDFRADVILFVFPDKDIAKLALHAKIPMRIGTAHRLWHWWYANKRVFFSRKKSDLHESQLNFKLLKPLGIDIIPTFEQITSWYGFSKINEYPHIKNMLPKDKFLVILHPKSKGSAKEWGLENFYQLAKSLENNDKINVFITGVQAEGELIMQEKPEIFGLKNVKNYTGKFSLEEMIYFIQQCNMLLSASTGTLHIASAMGINAWGIFPPLRPIHPARWQPIGKNAFTFVKKGECNKHDLSTCKNSNICACMQGISVKEIEEKILVCLSKV